MTDQKLAPPFTPGRGRRREGETLPEAAKRIIFEARADLGQDLEGLTDLLLDNLPELRNVNAARKILHLIGEPFPRSSTHWNPAPPPFSAAPIAAKAAVLADRKAGKDFRVASFMHPDDGRYINNQDAE